MTENVAGQASLTEGGTLNLSVPIGAEVRSASFTMSGGRRRNAVIPASIRTSHDGARWAEATVVLGSQKLSGTPTIAVEPGTSEVLLTTRTGRFAPASTSRLVAAGRRRASIVEGPSNDQVAVRLSSDETGFTVVVDPVAPFPHLTRIHVGFTELVVTGTLVGQWPTVTSVVAHRSSDNRDLAMEWEVDGRSFRAAAPVASMAASDGVWEILIRDESGSRPVRRGLSDRRDRRYDFSTPISLVAFEGGLARVRGYCARDGRLRLSVLAMGQDT